MKNKWEYSYRPKPDENSKFIFRKKSLKDLWDKEISGQLSDGMWENSWRGQHFNDYTWWNSLKTEVGSSTKLVGREWNIQAKTGFSRLIEYVGDEMLEIVRKTEPDATMATVRKYLNEISKAIRMAYGNEKNPGAGWHLRTADQAMRESDFISPKNKELARHLNTVAKLNYQYEEESTKQGVFNPKKNPVHKSVKKSFPVLALIAIACLSWWLIKKNQT
jgi:hypothetical protein